MKKPSLDIHDALVVYSLMTKNETKSPKKCRYCRCVVATTEEQLQQLDFCSWVCMQDWEDDCMYREFNGIHR